VIYFSMYEEVVAMLLGARCAVLRRSGGHA